jgi:dTMP kinase
VRRRGRFVTFEGGEGAGKSTQAAALAEWLKSLGIEAVLTREPGGSRVAEALREMLLAGRVAPFGADAEAIFFAVARADHMETIVRPALAAGRWVICDRFFDSTWAYQGVGGASAELLKRLEAIAVGDDRPDLTVILDISPAAGEARLSARGASRDRFEREHPDVHAARRQAFLAIARREPQRCIVVDASAGTAEVSRAVRAAVIDRLGPVGQRPG